MVKKRRGQFPKVAIIGNTSWGNTLGTLLGDKGAEVKLWTRSEAEAEESNQGRRSYSSTSHIEEDLSEAGLVIWVVPCRKLRENVVQAKDDLTGSMLSMSAAKGLEVDSIKSMYHVLAVEDGSAL